MANTATRPMKLNWVDYPENGKRVLTEVCTATRTRTEKCDEWFYS